MRDLLERLPGCSLHNQYGASETHVVCELSLAGATAGGAAIAVLAGIALVLTLKGPIGQITGAAIKQLTGLDTVQQQLAYLMRAGEPDAMDRMVGFAFGALLLWLGQKPDEPPPRLGERRDPSGGRPGPRS